MYRLDQDALLQIVELVTQEPKFNDMPTRCFTLPFIAAEFLCTDSLQIQKQIFDDDDFTILLKLFSFVDVPEEI